MILFGPVNSAMFDLPWSAVHAASGLGLGFGLFMMHSRISDIGRFMIGVGFLAAWEIIEAAAVRLGVMEPETFANVTGDMIIGPVGILIGWQLLRWGRAPRP
ncbi:MAG: hypothetical protein HY976_03195 [Candidatus Kerfeldbacteria bacterium]|nr:hypothetical protein [Candidatus Kerfeldbacteria bacterium]